MYASLWDSSALKKPKLQVDTATCDDYSTCLQEARLGRCFVALLVVIPSQEYFTYQSLQCLDLTKCSRLCKRESLFLLSCKWIATDVFPWDKNIIFCVKERNDVYSRLVGWLFEFSCVMGLTCVNFDRSFHMIYKWIFWGGRGMDSFVGIHYLPFFDLPDASQWSQNSVTRGTPNRIQPVIDGKRNKNHGISTLVTII